MPARCIEPARRPVDADVAAAPSKSWTHRAMVAAALAGGVSRIDDPLDAADTRATRDGLGALGIRVEDDGTSWVVHGRDGAVPGGGRIDCGASGTTARFLTALAGLGDGPSRLDGSPRLRERPLEDLLAALGRLGASIEATNGGLPVSVGGRMRGGAVEIPGDRSSQYASALLLVGAALEDGLRLDVAPPRASFAYTLLTAGVLASFGVTVQRPAEGRFVVAPQRIAPVRLRAEGDHSSASYLFLAAAITGGRVRVRGLDPASVQPDARFSRDLAALGCLVTSDEGSITVEGGGRLSPFDWDLSGAPDLAPTAAVLALFCDGRSRLRGLANLRDKESDRLHAVTANLVRFGADVQAEAGAISLRPPHGGPRGALVDVAGDHRIAMAFATAGLAVAGVTVSDATVVAKSYPGFWDDLGRLVPA